MAPEFDPYHKWLGILPKDQPPHHYRLLGIEALENDLDVIETAADRQLTTLRRYQSGEHAALASKLLNEVAQARLLLLKPESKRRYDEELRKRLDPTAAFQIETNTQAAGRSAVLQKRTVAAGTQPIWKKPAVMIGATAACVLLVVAIVMLSPSSKGKAAPHITADADSDGLTKATDKVAKKTSRTTMPATTDEKPKKASSLAASVEMAAGPAVNLLKPMDLQKQRIKGEITTGTNGVLRFAARTAIRLPTPGPIPDDYRLDITTERPEGVDTLFVAFPCSGRMTVLIVDGWNGAQSGLCIDGRHPNDNATTHTGMALAPNRTNDISIVVHSGAIRVTCNGESIVDWNGNPDRLYADPSWAGLPGKDELLLCTANVPYVVSRFELTPLRKVAEPKPAEIKTPVDLLRDVDIARDTFVGKWARDKAGIHSVSRGRTGIQLGRDFPEEYTLVVRTKRPLEQEENATLVLGFPAGDSLAEFVFDNRDCCGLEVLDGRRWYESVTRIPGTQLKGGLEHEVRITVLKRRIALDIDGQRLLDWAGDFCRLTAPGEWVGPRPRALNIGVDSEYQIMAARIEPPQKLPDPPTEISAPIDLLAKINDSRDAYWGIWRLDGGVLKSPLSEAARLSLPVQVPEEYTLKVDVEKQPGGEDDSLNVGLPMGDHIVHLALDCFRSTKSGIELDDQGILANPTLREGRVFEPGKARTLVCRVSRGGIEVECDGEPLIQWRGNPCRRLANPTFTTPLHRRPFIGTWRTTYHFNRIELSPNASPMTMAERPRVVTGGNLLKSVLPDIDAQHGEWTLLDGALTSPADEAARLAIPIDVPSRYALSAVVERIQGQVELLTTLPIGDSVATVMIDGYGPKISGLDPLDGQRPEHNPTRRDGACLPAGKAVQVDYIVAPDSIRVLVDGESIVDWKGDPRRCGLSPVFQRIPLDARERRQLALGSWVSRFKISQLVLSTDSTGATSPPRLLRIPSGGKPKPGSVANKPATAGPGILNQKEPLPDAKAVSAADAKVREVFKDEIEKAKSAAARSALVRKILDQADDRKVDLATVYALQKAARDLAAEAGDVALAFEAVDQLTGTFDADAGVLKETTLELAAKGAKTSTQRKAIAEAALELAEAAADNDNFPSAERFSKIAISAARGAGDPALSKRVAARAKELDEQRKAYESLQADLATLEANPNDADANLRVGRYECFTKQDWDSGLARLAKGSDQTLRELAAREMAKPTGVKAKLALADGWDELANRDKTSFKSALEDHAEEWYRQVLGELDGIDKLRVEKKLAGAETQKTKREAKSGPSIRSLRPGVIGEYFGDVEFKKRVLVRIDPEIDFDWGGGSPDVAIPPDNFGIRWHGYIRAPRPGKYTLILICDNGCRMTLDGKTVIDQLGTGGQHRLTAEVELTDKPSPFQIDFNEGIFTAWCRLRWSHEGKQGFAEQAIGGQFLFHTREQEKLNTQGK